MTSLSAQQVGILQEMVSKVETLSYQLFLRCTSHAPQCPLCPQAYSHAEGAKCDCEEKARKTCMDASVASFILCEGHVLGKASKGDSRAIFFPKDLWVLMRTLDEGVANEVASRYMNAYARVATEVLGTPFLSIAKQSRGAKPPRKRKSRVNRCNNIGEAPAGQSYEGRALCDAYVRGHQRKLFYMGYLAGCYDAWSRVSLVPAPPGLE